MDFRAIVMAAGRGSRMMELTTKFPKALLPIGSKPMIWYPLNLLQKNGFKEAIVVLPAANKSEISAALHCMTDIKLQLHEEVIQNDEDSGTADALRQILQKQDIKTDILVLSCDLITNVSLDPLFAVHYAYNSGFTALFAPLPPDLHTGPAPGPKSKRKIEQDFIGLDCDTKRLVFMASEADFEDELSVKRHTMKICSHLDLFTDLMDAHLYLLNKSVCDVWIQEEALSSLKGEVVPLLTRRQFTSPETTQWKDSEFVKDIKSMTTWNGVNCGQNETAYCCYGYIADNGFLLRANNYATYMYANRQVSRLWPSIATDGNTIMRGASFRLADTGHVSNDCFVGKDVSVGSKANLKTCVVSQECEIGANVKLTNCVLLDRVTIGDDCNLQGCIVGKGCTLEKCNLKDCVIAGDQMLSNTKSTNEVITNDDPFMEI